MRPSTFLLFELRRYDNVLILFEVCLRRKWNPLHIVPLLQYLCREWFFCNYHLTVFEIGSGRLFV